MTALANHPSLQAAPTTGGRGHRLPAWPLTGPAALPAVVGARARRADLLLVAVPMVVLLLRRRAAGHRLPPGFVLWLLFLAAVGIGLSPSAPTRPARSPGRRPAGWWRSRSGSACTWR